MPQKRAQTRKITNKQRQAESRGDLAFNIQPHTPPLPLLRITLLIPPLPPFSPGSLFLSHRTPSSRNTVRYRLNPAQYVVQSNKPIRSRGGFDPVIPPAAAVSANARYYRAAAAGREIWVDQGACWSIAAQSPACAPRECAKEETAVDPSRRATQDFYL
ncbi:hypothetical protein LY76DRAFT_72442 [Colletotrichum caudatum]|nr:hypothetical protein LY76DRAFT_72442 [Colletotrichum caudatum]